MALTLGSLNYASIGNRTFVTGTIAFDSSYPTGGESLAAADLGLAKIDFIQVSPKGFLFEYDYTNSLLLVKSQGYAHGTGGSVTTDDYPITAGPGVTSGISIQATTGAGAVTANLGPLVETFSTDDLSTVTGVRFFAVGF
jgi:hypothetical protein